MTTVLGGFSGGQAEYLRVPYADVGPIKESTSMSGATARTRSFCEVTDDDIGLSVGFDVATAKSLGLNIVQILTQQLAGRFEMQGGTGKVGC